MEPCDLSELKDMLRLDVSDTSQDILLAGLEVAARNWCEILMRRKCVAQTWMLETDFFPGYIDMKIAGSQVSSPFVSGANAILVGIRYCFRLPYPPVQSLVSFVYQNANGQVTSEQQGPTTIASVSNPSGNPIVITTSTTHNLISGSTVTIAGNSDLVTALIGQPSQVITVLDPVTLQFNGSLGTGSGIAGGGTITGLNFILDLQSQPARLTPVFGQMWPVSRVVVNSVQIAIQVGFATPIAISSTAYTAALGGYTSFTAANVGRPISIPGAGVNGGCLNTIIASVSGGVGSLRDLPQNSLIVPDGGAPNALLVNYGAPANWDTVKTAIKLLVNFWFVNRIPTAAQTDSLKKAVRAQLGPAMLGTA
jgi:hypothetical protein